MDDIVRAAIAKWPNVPHCYGWLALDARGNWRMRDERCQTLNLQGDIIRHPALLDFIHRNYLHDQDGQWYFQNGPQRVYVDLEATPYIARTDHQGLLLHTGKPMRAPAAAYMDNAGILYFVEGQVVARVDDRDLAECLTWLRLQDALPADDLLEAWLAGEHDSIELQIEFPFPSNSSRLTLNKIQLSELMQQAGYVQRPRKPENSCR